MAFLGSRKIKYELNIQVHSVKASLNQLSRIKIQAKVGLKKEETPPMQYNITQGLVVFEYPITINIAMTEKNGSFQKKIVNFIMFEVIGKSTKKLGKTQLEFSEVADTGEPYTRAELSFLKCSDPNAKLIVSLDLAFIGKNSRSFASSDLMVGRLSDIDYSMFESEEPSFMKSMIIEEQEEEDNIQDRRQGEIFEKPEFLENLAESRAENEPKSIESDKESILTISSTSDLAEKANEILQLPYLSMDRPKLIRRRSTQGRLTISTRKDFFNDTALSNITEVPSPKKFFITIAKENIVNPKESQVESESSSSDEEPAFLDPPNLSSKIPKIDLSDAEPNEKSKLDQLKSSENQSGLSGRDSTCSKCVIF